MTSIALTGTPSSLRMTARGRRVLAALLLVPAAIGIGWVASSAPAAFAGGELDPAQQSQVEQFASHTVLSGETLWSIADEINGPRDIRDVMDEIVRLNQLDTVSLAAGQVIALPNLR